MPKLKGKPPSFRMGPEHRLKIANSNILSCLVEHAEGTREMSSTQVTAGLGLLKKVMPDMTESENRNMHEVGDTLASLLKDIAANRNLLTPIADDTGGQ